MSNETFISRKNQSKAGVAAAELLIMVGLFASVAYAVTVHGTKNPDWGEAKDGFADPRAARCAAAR